MLANSRTAWKVREMPRCVIWLGLSPVISTVEEIRPRVGGVEAGDDVEECGLAGAVRADHADYLTLVDHHVEPVTACTPPNRLETPGPRAGSSVGLRRRSWPLRAVDEPGVLERRRPACSSLRPAAWGMSPSGRKIMIDEERSIEEQPVLGELAEQLGQPHQHQSPDDHSRDAAHTADDDDHQHVDRDQRARSCSERSSRSWRRRRHRRGSRSRRRWRKRAA